MVTHTNLTSNISMLYWLLMQEVEIKQTSVSQILVMRKMVRVTLVVTYVKLIVVHIRLLITPKRNCGRRGDNSFQLGN
jgi:hypothetical protein